MRSTSILSGGSVDTRKTQTKASFGAELMLWLRFLVRGMIYPVWADDDEGEALSEMHGSEHGPRRLAEMAKRQNSSHRPGHDRFGAPGVDACSASLCGDLDSTRARTTRS